MNRPTLTERVEQSREAGKTGLPLPQATRVVAEVAAAIDALHAQGRTQGDIEASRIAVPHHGPAQLLEAAHTDPASESVGGDVAGLVSAAYYALCGTPPSYFRAMSSLTGASSVAAPASFLVSPGVHRPDLPPAVCDVFTRGLSPRPQDRYPSAGGFATALREAAGPAPVSRGAALSPKRLLAAVAALIVLAALAAGVWLGRNTRQPARPLPTAASIPAPPSGPVPSPALPLPEALPAPLPSHPKSVARHVSHPPAARSAAPSSLTAALGGSTLPSAGPVPVVPVPVVPVPVVPVPVVPVPVVPHPVPRARREASVVNPVPARKPVPGRTFLRVYARQFVSMSDVIGHRLSLVPARRVLIDGRPSQALAAGHWALVPPGRHKLAFYPAPGIPFDPNTRFWVQVAPNRRRAFQIPLPRHPGGIPGSAHKKSPSRPV